MRMVYFCYPSLQVWDRQHQGPGRPQSGFGHGAEEPLVQDLNIANSDYSWCYLQKNIFSVLFRQYCAPRMAAGRSHRNNAGAKMAGLLDKEVLINVGNY